MVHFMYHFLSFLVSYYPHVLSICRNKVAECYAESGIRSTMQKQSKSHIGLFHLSNRVSACVFKDHTIEHSVRHENTKILCSHAQTPAVISTRLDREQSFAVVLHYRLQLTTTTAS